MRREEVRKALVTGASSGIGESFCRLLASKGVDLILHGRNEKRLHALAEDIGKLVSVEVIVAELSNREERRRVVEVLRLQAPELIVNNAGFGLYGEALSYSTDEQLDVLEVNGSALLELTLEGARTLVSKGKKGIILNVASAAAFPVFPCFAVYGAAKAFAVKLSESLDEEMRPYGVRVLASCPGMVATRFRERAGGAPGKRESFSTTMTSEFAAEELWRQVQAEKPIRIFNVFYRWMVFLVLYILSKRWVARIVKGNINKRHAPRPIIKNPEG